MNPTPEQQAAIQSRAPLVCVSAAAGSGKTRVLVERIISLLEAKGGAKPDLGRIVAITFTEKAAAEMRHRLWAEFRKRATQGDADTMNFWRAHERTLENAHIETIHAFCTALLKEHALAIGLDPDFGVMDDAREVLTRNETVQTTLHDLLLKQDEHAVTLCAEYGFAGTVRMLKEAFKKRHTLEVALNNDAYRDAAALQQASAEEVPRELANRCAYLRTHPHTRKWIQTFRAFDGRCSDASHPREKIRLLALDFLQKIMGGAPTEAVMDACGALLGQSARGGSKKAWVDEADIKTLGDLQKDFKGWAGKHLSFLETSPELEEAYAGLLVAFVQTAGVALDNYRQTLARMNMLDFEALISTAHDRLLNDEAFCRRIAARFDHLLLDEFQDTDQTQLEIVQALTRCSPGPGLFVVGDVKQSIYYFRGADVDVFNGLQAQAPEKFNLKLTQNFRTTANVVEFINHFFKESGLLCAVEPQYIPMNPNRPAVDHPCVEMLMPAAPPDVLAEGGKANAGEMRRREARAIANRIQQFCCAPDAPKIVCGADGNSRQTRYSDVALLLRAFSDIHIYENALRDAGIPYMVISGKGFYQRQEVMDILNVLKVAINPYDEDALLAFLRSPLAALHDESIQRLAQMGPLARVFQGDAQPEHFTQPAELARARTLIRTLLGMGGSPISDMLRFVLRETQFEATLLAQYLGVQKLSNIRKLLAFAEEAGRSLSLRAFVSYLEEVRAVSDQEADAAMLPEGANIVLVMTIHKSKGLEFPVVFIPDMNRTKRSSTGSVHGHKNFGFVLSHNDEKAEPKASPVLAQILNSRIRRDEEAESWRTLYVAMTRARDYLVLCGQENAAKGTWLEAILDTFKLESPKNGQVLRQGEATFTVTTEVADWPMQASVAAPPATLPPAGEVARMVAPLPRPKSTAKSVSVTAILHHMAKGLDEHEERPAETGTDEDAPPRQHPNAQAAMARGLVIHRVFEFYDFKTKTPPDLQAVLDEAAIPPSRRAALSAAVGEVLQNFAHSGIAQEIAAGSKLDRELPFLYPLDGTVIVGTIDLLVDGELLVDYKTGKHNPDRHARYDWQLMLYAAALREITGTPPRRALVHYLDEGKTVETTLAPQALDSAIAQARQALAEMA